MNPTLERNCVFGFGLQTGQGLPKTSGLTWIPLRGETDFSRNPNLEAVDQADGYGYDRLMHSQGIWIEGGAGLSVQPVSGSLANLISWMVDRDSYGQGRWATVVLANPRVRDVYQDVKVGTSALRLNAGRPLDLELRLMGIRPMSNPTISLGAIQDGAPYTFDETTVRVDWDASGSVGSAEKTIKTLEINIDNLLQSGEEGLRLGGLYMETLYNNGDPVVTGSFTRDYVDPTTEVMDPFELWLAQMVNPSSDAYNAQMQVDLTRGGVTMSLQMKNMRFRKVNQPAKGTRRGTMTQTVEFLALACADGTPGLVLTSN